MKVTSLQLKNFRSFANMDPIDLSDINIFIGANNSGKSSILRALYLMQENSGSGIPDIRIGEEQANINIIISELTNAPESWGFQNETSLTVEINITKQTKQLFLELRTLSNNIFKTTQIQGIEPFHFIVPYLSKRKTSGYTENIGTKNAMIIMPNMSNLAARLSRISNPSFPGYDQYSESCKAILGFLVTAVTSDNGLKPGVYLSNGETISIEQMGEGVPNIVTLLIDLTLSEGKLFLIEEPENDLHPKALKALLDLIKVSSKSNQFVISTHSNIVVCHLGSAQNTLVYNIITNNTTEGLLQTEAIITQTESTPQARLDILRSLGYSFSDFDLWDGWLILEESSAERIIRDYLIPWFAPKLTRIRTLAVNGINNIEPTFQDFQRLALFTHLEEAYRNAAWVRVDGDDIGNKTIAELQKKFPSWLPDRFATYNHDNFEKYYPNNFSDEAAKVIGIVNKQQKREEKRLLLIKVLEWLDENEERGKVALCESAKEIITDLQQIESQLAALRCSQRTT